MRVSKKYDLVPEVYMYDENVRTEEHNQAVGGIK